MHYKNGREAKTGDPVVGPNYNGAIAGTIHSLNPGTTTCNAQVAVPMMGGVTHACISVGDFYHADDAYCAVDKNTQALKEAGSPLVTEGPTEVAPPPHS